jgi:Short C-terminal domain
MVRAMGLFSRKPKQSELDEIPPEAAAIVEQLTEMFPGASVSVDEPVEIGMVGGGHDRISQLERIAKLREQGALTESEFQAEKTRILGQD